jgi:hypothetical protein
MEIKYFFKYSIFFWYFILLVILGLVAYIYLFITDTINISNNEHIIRYRKRVVFIISVVLVYLIWERLYR